MIRRQNVTSTPSAMGVNANYFRVIEISTRVKATFIGKPQPENNLDGFSLETEIKSGFAIDFTAFGVPCTQIILESEHDQTIEFWASKAKADDSSVSGTLSLGSGKRVTYEAPVTVTSASPVEVFPLDLQRKIATFSIDGAVYVNDTNGIKLPAGLHVWENGQPMRLIAESTDVEVRRQDEGY